MTFIVIAIIASFHVLGMRRSVMNFVYILARCFAMVSSPAFSGSMVTYILSLLSHLSFSSALMCVCLSHMSDSVLCLLVGTVVSQQAITIFNVLFFITISALAS